MIVEQAMFSITAGSEREFEAAIAQAREVIAEARGFHSLRLMRGIERPSRYLLIVEWDTVDDHMVGFRESELFVRWRDVIGSFFASPPEVEHFEAPVVTKYLG
jgi:heme-degrading monooxygenase HmoA